MPNSSSFPAARPLPVEINGRYRTLAFLCTLLLLFLVVGVGIWQGGRAAAGLEFVGLLVFSLWMGGMALLMGWLIITFPRRIRLRPDEISVRYLFHRRLFKPAEIAHALLRYRAARGRWQPEPAALLVYFTDGRSLHIGSQEITLPLNELLDLFIVHYRLSLAQRREPADVPFFLFGAGSRRPFGAYLEGRSSVEVRSLEEITAWLEQCAYIRDPEQFSQPDYWQLPEEFEQRRQGDCEDFALWAWRKLKEIGIPAQFVVGYAQWSDHSQGMHAWITFEQNGRPYILEGTNRAQPIRPEGDLREVYHPWYAVDHQLKTYRYHAFAASGAGDEGRVLD